MSEAEVNKGIFQRLTDEVWNNGDPEVADELISPDYIYRNPAIEMSVNGPKQYKDFVDVLRAAYPDLHFSIDEMVAEGNRVAASWTFEGTFQDITAGPKPVKVTGITWTRIIAGKIVEERVHHDALGLLRQIGAISA